MMRSDNELLRYLSSPHYAPYNASIASSASSSSTSVWSDAASQSSDDTSVSGVTSDSSDPCESYCYQPVAVPQPKFTRPDFASRVGDVPQELRQNPRRSNGGAGTRSGCPPSLVRQTDRKINFVDNLVDSSTQIVEAIWPLSHVHRQESCSKAVLPLRTFIQETLRRSRTSYSTLQVALYYLILIKPHVPSHDFTMEQPDDSHVNRVLQCGRRMFLAALILASKYLQDRNYSARAWSKISGLQTHEINQNEMAFLVAVNWKLHITDEVFKRWTEVVMKYTPSQPPSPGSICTSASMEQQCEDWKNLILQLNPELDNVMDLIPSSPLKAELEDGAFSPRSVMSSSRSRSYDADREAADATPTPKSYSAPTIMEPPAPTVYTPGRFAPALGLLPTPRLTPNTTGFSTPAASAASHMLGDARCSSMGMAMSQASSTMAAQTLDRWPCSGPRSPSSAAFSRRSSLAASVSTASSPESMISDSSRTSRSSSISSASSLASAPATKLDVQARCRYAKLCSEKYSLRPAIASVPEDYEECLTSSPESYTSTVGKDLMKMEMSLDHPTTRRGYEGFDMDDATSAARALQELQQYGCSRGQTHPRARQGLKRSRPMSIENPLQENVREMLGMADRKRVCYPSNLAPRSCSISALHPAVGGPGGPGMWNGILN